MLGPDTTWYLAVAAVLFGIGTTGVILRRSPLIVLLSLEIMLNASNLALVGFSRHFASVDGQMFAISVMAVAAAEVCRRPRPDRRVHPPQDAARRRHADGAARMIAAAPGSACSRRSPARSLITLAGTLISRTAAGWISTVSVFVGFAGAVVAFVAGRWARAPTTARTSRPPTPGSASAGFRVQGADADPRRPDLADDDADHHRRRRPDRLVLDRLHEGRGRGAPLLRVHGVLRLRDADARDGRQPAAAARRLGPRRPRLLPPDRLLPRPARGGRGGQEGVHHERDRRRDDGARASSCSSSRPGTLDFSTTFDAAATRPALVEHRQPRRARPARRRRREVGPAAAPHLAARRDGRPDAGLRPDPRGDDGDRRRLPDRAHPPDLRGRARTSSTSSAIIGGVTLVVAGRDRARAVGHQARDRVLDDVADRLHVPRGRDRRLRLRDVPPDDARVLQGAALPRGRRRSSTTSPASRTSARWAACAR